VPVESFSTPRRLTARVGRMPERQEDLDETITGPPVSARSTRAGEPTPAALGFAKKQGVPFEALERVKTDKGEYLAAKKHVAARARSTRCRSCSAAAARSRVPKQMHWDAMLEDGSGELVFGRRSAGCSISMAAASSRSRSAACRTPPARRCRKSRPARDLRHRFLATSGRAGRSIKVRTFDELPRAACRSHFVILEHTERRESDRGASWRRRRASSAAAVHLREHAALLAEVADLVEYPGRGRRLLRARLPRVAAGSC
jgi:glycyl-tRNA synthetase beta chain